MTSEPATGNRRFGVDELAEQVEAGDIRGSCITDREEIRVLDVFSGPGGVGYALRDLFTSPRVDGWFLGIDNTDYSDRYPGEFVQMDASELTLDALGLDKPVDLVWLSPPCQPYARPSHVHYDDPKAVFDTFDDLGVHDLADRLGKEYVIENVVGCDDLQDAVTLNGVAFDERYVYRRQFETSFELPAFNPSTAGADTVPMQSVGEKEFARVKGCYYAVDWEKTEIRSAIPGKFVAYVLSHCPTLPEIEVPGGNIEYVKRGAGGGNRSLSDFDDGNGWSA